MTHNLLHNKRGLILGAVDERSLAWAVAEQCHAEGATIVLSNTETAIRLGNVRQLADRLSAPLIACDMRKDEEVEHLLQEAVRQLGGPLDFVLHACAMSNNLRRQRDYDDVNYTYYHDTLDISALSLHRLLQTAKKLDAIAEYGSVVSLTYLAAERFVHGYNDMAEAKAMLQSITRNFGAIYGQHKHVRINTISQSPTPTRAGNQVSGITPFFDYADALAPLGNANQQDCAELCVMLFSDYTRKLTMQTIYNDGGFSQAGITQGLINYLEKDRL